MPDFSVLDETRLTLLLEYAILENWNSVSSLDFITNLKLHKIMYDVSETKNLPITRSWYMLGNYINSPHIVQREFAKTMFLNPRNVELGTGEIVDISILIEKYSEIYQTLKTLARNFMDRSNIIRTNSWEIRRTLYRNKAPKKFASCYQTSVEYFAFLSRLKIRSYYPTSVNFMINDCTNLTTDLHKSIRRIEEFEDLFDILVDFTDTIEDAVMKTVLDIKNTKFNDLNFNYLQTQEQIYRDVVWKQFAKIIAIETVKGPRKSEIIEEYTSDLQDLSSVKLVVKENKQKGKELNLFLTENDFNKLFSTQDKTMNNIIEVENILQRG